MTIGNTQFLVTQFFDRRTKFQLDSSAEFGNVQLVQLNLDATIDESHSYKSNVSQNPVESGVQITDHIHNLPAELSLTGMVTDSPIQYLAGVRNLVRDGGVSPTQNAMDMLMKLRDSRTPFTVVTGLKTYKNMVIQNLTIPRNVTLGQQLRFTMDLVEIRIVNTVVTTLELEPSKKDSASKKSDKGTQTPPEPSEPVQEQAKTIFKRIKDTVSSAFN